MCVCERCAQVDFENIQQAISTPDTMAAALKSASTMGVTLPCFEVAGFGHYLHDPGCMSACEMLDWPRLWAAALVDEAHGTAQTYLYADPEDAREDALRFAALLLPNSCSKFRDEIKSRKSAGAGKSAVPIPRSSSLPSAIFIPLQAPALVSALPCLLP